MTLGFPGPLDASKRQVATRRRISPVLARGGMIAAAASARLRDRVARARRRRQRRRRRGRRRARRHGRHARPLRHRRRSLRHRRRPGSRLRKNGSPSTAAASPPAAPRSSSCASMARTPRWPPRDGPARSALAVRARVRRRVLPAARALRQHAVRGAGRAGHRLRRRWVPDLARRGASASSPRPTCCGAYPASAAVFLPGGEPPAPGDILRQPDLARSISLIARDGPDVFYRGAIAKEIATFLAANGGALTADDFADHETAVSPPLDDDLPGLHRLRDRAADAGLRRARGAQHLRAGAAGGDGSALGRTPSTPRSSALRLAFADRLAHAGDPDYVETPLDRLLSKEWAAEQYAAIDRATRRTSTPACSPPATPPRWSPSTRTG